MLCGLNTVADINVLLQCFGYVSRTNAACTHFDGGYGSISDSFYLLYIGTPYGAGLIVSMTDIVPEAGAFSAYFTFS